MNRFFTIESRRRNRWVRFGKRTHREGCFEGADSEIWSDWLGSDCGQRPRLRPDEDADATARGIFELMKASSCSSGCWCLGRCFDELSMTDWGKRRRPRGLEKHAFLRNEP